MIRAILVDAMFTVFVPRSGLNRFHILQTLILRLLNKKVDLGNLETTYTEKRAYWENRLPAHHGEKWAVIDREIIRALFPDISFETAAHVGRQISTATLTDPEFYEVLPETIAFLEEARKRGILVIVASNHDTEKLDKLSRHFGIRDLFHAAYVSTDIGYEKPDTRFFQAIFYREQLDPTECVMVGNNPVNDIKAANDLGVTAVLYDKDNKYQDFSGYRVTSFREIWNLDLFMT